MKIVVFILLMIILIMIIVSKPWKQKIEEEKWRNSPSPETNEKIHQMNKNTEWSKGAKDNEHEFYH